MNVKFSTYDIYLASTLLSLGHNVDFLNRKDRGKVGFCFSRVGALDEVIQRYWARDLLIEPQTLFASLKALKNRIYSDNL